MLSTLRVWRLTISRIQDCVLHQKNKKGIQECVRNTCLNALHPAQSRVIISQRYWDIESLTVLIYVILIYLYPSCSCIPQPMLNKSKLFKSAFPLCYPILVLPLWFYFLFYLFLHYHVSILIFSFQPHISCAKYYLLTTQNSVL